jgi:hypothetical protein
MPAFLTTQDVRAAFGWNAQSQRYTDLATGRFVPLADVKRAIGGPNGVIVNARIEIETISEQMARGEIEIGEWQERMGQAVKNLDLATMAAGKGGVAQLTQRDYGLAGQRLRFDYERLELFARDVESGRIKGNRIVERAKLYANRRNGVYENTRRDAAQEVFSQERRTLGDAEHCSVCVEEAAKGWVEIGTLRKIGDSPCRMNCRCSFRFRVTPTK